MIGNKFKVGRRVQGAMALVAALGLAACDEGGGGLFGSRDNAATEAAPAGPSRVVQTDRDVERPDIFEVTDRGLWDGRPSLGGVWVAHPDVQDPERVIIRNPDTGQSVVGALFRRERENPGPLLQVSSDAAVELGLLAGAPTQLSVIALRREEVEVPQEPAAAPEENAVVASLAAPVSVAATALDDAPSVDVPSVDVPSVDVPAVDPIAGAAAAIAAVEAAAAAPVAAAVGGATAPFAQIGVFSVEANANSAAQTIRDAGIPSSVEPQDAGGRTVWRVVAGPVPDDATLAQLKALGYVDAFVVPTE